MSAYLGKSRSLVVERSGGCRGQKKMGWNLAKEKGAPCLQFLPDSENSLDGCDPAVPGAQVSEKIQDTPVNLNFR